nr:hypothetical protein [uncultured Mucilaginibacter sp.]
MPIPENTLVTPALVAMYNSNNHEISTSDLIDILSSEFNLDAEDSQILDDRKDTKFSQKVRNLKSHKTFEKLNYAEEIDGGFRLLEGGVIWLTQNGFIYTN